MPMRRLGQSSLEMDLAFGVRALSDTSAVLSVRGRLDAVTALELRGRVKQLISEGRPELVCDLNDVGILDSAGLSALVACLKAARESGGFFRMVAVNERVAHVFRLTMLDRVFEVHRSVDAALAPNETPAPWGRWAAPSMHRPIAA